MKEIILTAPVAPAVHKEVKTTAKSHDVPIRVLCAMLIKQGLDDLKAGRIQITRPTLASAKGGRR